MVLHTLFHRQPWFWPKATIWPFKSRFFVQFFALQSSATHLLMFIQLKYLYVYDWLGAGVGFTCVSCSFCEVEHLTANGCQKLPAAFDYPLYIFFPSSVCCLWLSHVYIHEVTFSRVQIVPAVDVCCYFCWAAFMEQSVKGNVTLCFYLNTVRICALRGLFSKSTERALFWKMLQKLKVKQLPQLCIFDVHQHAYVWRLILAIRLAIKILIREGVVVFYSCINQC